jgi:glycine hydroxymethyltransferase
MVTSGIRAGSSLVATQGMGTEEMARVADMIDRAITGSDDDRAAVRGEVSELVAAFPAY